MKKEAIKKILAAGVSAAMLAGSAIPTFAANGTGLTKSEDGQGTSTGHLDDTYVEASVPTDGTITQIFSFYVDPENIIEKGGKFDGNTAVTAVDDLVYFPATSGYASTSQALELEIKNYRAVDVAVSVTVDADTANLIDLVDSADGIDNTAAADDAALYLTLTVGDKSPVAITEEGASSTYTQAAQNSKFDVVGSVASGFSVSPKSDATGWTKVSISMAGKAQLVKNATGIVAPKVSLSYVIGLHQDSYTVTYNANYGETPATATESVLSAAHPTGTAAAVVALKTRDGYDFVGWFDGTGADAEEVDLDEISAATTVYAKWTRKAPTATPSSMSTSAKSATISFVPDGVTLTSAKVIKIDNSEVNLTANTQYTYTDNVFAIATGKETLLDSTKYKSYVLTYSNDDVVTISIVAP